MVAIRQAALLAIVTFVTMAYAASLQKKYVHLDPRQLEGGGGGDGNDSGWGWGGNGWGNP
ncbi:hypothetical protein IWQ62_003132 [Dispira parvispora]|uniref:Uncharacterized protein n=1 Tax=Dispira parvispora TaxID=1520584 RepID=A0A9W8ASD9_9FUNG|nr:hypothetical protein IWQ62_003132 [Dispira parvispora]